MSDAGDEFYASEDLEAILEQARSIKEAVGICVFQPGGSMVSTDNVKSVDVSQFTRYMGNGGETTVPLQFNGEHFVYLNEQQTERNSDENKVFCFMSKNKLNITGQEEKVALVVMYHELGLFVCALCAENNLRIIVGDLYIKLVKEMA